MTAPIPTVQTTLIDVPRDRAPAPPTVYFVRAFYCGPASNTGHWKFFREEFTVEEAAREFIAKLSRFYPEAQIVRIGS